MNNQQRYGVKHIPSAIADKIPKKYPWMSEDQHCDVCVIGGGVTGALCALKIAEKGHGVTLITSGAIGFGQTSTLPEAIEADCGCTITELTRTVSIDAALKLYSMGQAALDELENLCHSLDAAEGKSGFTCHFQRRDTLLYTDDQSELELLDREYLARKHNGLDCTYITREQARDSFSFDLYGGILGKEFGATLNPYHLTHLCLMRAEQLGVNIFEHTEAIDIQTPKNSDGSVIITTSTHRTVYADRLILATGSEGMESLLSHPRRRTALSVTTNAIADDALNGWSGECLIRTFGTPKRSYCVTPERRISACGMGNRGPFRMERLKELLQNTDFTNHSLYQMEDAIAYLFPAVPDMKTEFEYACHYFTAPDELPLIGSHSDYHNCIFALCSGPSTLIYAQLAAQTAADMVEALYNDDMSMFQPERFSKK